MKLNMHLILEELSDRNPKASITEDRLDRRFDFHSPMIDFRTSSPNLVYNVSASQLREMVDRGLRPHGNFVCSGIPPKEVIDAGCNIIWIEEEMPIGQLVVKMTEVFTRYMLWESSIHEAIISGATLKRIAEISEPIVNRPIWAWDPQYKTLFNVIGKKSKDSLPDDYFFQSDHSAWNAWMIAQWEEEAQKRGGRLLTSHEPFFMPTPKENGLSYRCLCSNLFHGSKRLATVCIDEVGDPLTDRDFILLDILNTFMTEALGFGGRATSDTVHSFDDTLFSLLRGKPATKWDIEQTCAMLEWEKSDHYFVVAMEPDNESYSDLLMTRVAHELCAGGEGLLYAVFDHRLLLVVNDRICGWEFRTFSQELEHRLRDQGISMRLGVSSLWTGLGKLPLPYRQATKALRMGEARNLESCVFFDDFMLHAALLKFESKREADIFTPFGLRELRRHDAENEDGLEPVLRAYLDNNCSMTATSKALFAHRNTVAYKIERIKKITGSEFSDPDERLLFSWAMRL